MQFSCLKCFIGVSYFKEKRLEIDRNDQKCLKKSRASSRSFAYMPVTKPCPLPRYKNSKIQRKIKKIYFQKKIKKKIKKKVGQVEKENWKHF